MPPDTAELTRDELVGYLVPAIRALLAPAVAAAQAAGHGHPRAGAPSFTRPW